MDTDSDLIGGRSASRRALFALIGAVQGGLLYALIEYGETVIGWKSGRMALALVVMIAPTLFLFADETGRRRPAVVFAMAIGLLAALLFLSVDARADRSPGSDFPMFIIAMICIAAIPLPFYLCWGETGRIRFPYDRLFHHAWTTPHIFLGAAAFTGVLWIVLILWGQLFMLIEVDFFADLFDEPFVSFPVTGLAFGLAVAILRDWARVVAAARNVILILLRVLAPVVAGAIGLFVLFLPFTGLAPLWDRDSPTSILIAAIALSVVLANSIVEADEQSSGDQRLLTLSAVVLIALLPVLVALAAVAAGLRIDQHGLTPDRAYVAILIGVAGLYGLAYLWALAVRRRHWQSGVRMLNKRLAAVVVLIAIAVCTPVIDVQRLSAEDQVNRLLSGRVSAEAFDYYFLRYRLGHAGEAAAARLRAAEDHPEHARIVAALDRADDASDCPGCGSIDDDTARALALMDSPAIRVLPDGAEAPDAFRAYIAEHRSWTLTQCSVGDQPGCFLIIADLFGDDRPEAVLLHRSSRALTTYVGEDGRWRPLPTTHMHDLADADYDALIAALEAGEMSVVTPSHRTVRAGGLELPITPRR